MAEKTFMGEVIRGIIKDNPVFVLVLGLCPTLAVTTSFANGLGMGLAFTFVLLGSNFFVSLIRKQIPSGVRIPIFLLIICTFVTIVDMLLEAYVPPMYDALGIFIPLIVVNCIVIGRSEAYANKNPVIPSIADAIGISIGYMLVLLLIGSIRELFGTGKLQFVMLMNGADGIKFYDVGKPIEIAIKPAIVMISPAGAFLTIASLMLLFKIIGDRKRMAKIRKEEAGL